MGVWNLRPFSLGLVPETFTGCSSDGHWRMLRNFNVSKTKEAGSAPTPSAPKQERNRLMDTVYETEFSHAPDEEEAAVDAMWDAFDNDMAFICAEQAPLM